jgi:hypothetical protein
VSLTALEASYGAHAQARPLGQSLLRHPGGPTVPPEQRPEFFRSVVHNLDLVLPGGARRKQCSSLPAFAGHFTARFAAFFLVKSRYGGKIWCEKSPPEARLRDERI